MGHTAPLLQMAGICKSFGSAQVLREVHLRLDAGEVLALLGANGAGKSTLVKILCGVYSRDAGTVRLADQAVRYDRPEEAIAHGVRFLPQEVSVCPTSRLPKTSSSPTCRSNARGLAKKWTVRRYAPKRGHCSTGSAATSIPTRRYTNSPRRTSA